MSKADTKLTSIKLLDNIYRSFKVVSFQNATTLQRVVNRTLYLYLNDKEFRTRVDELDDLADSGSNF